MVTAVLLTGLVGLVGLFAFGAVLGRRPAPQAPVTDNDPMRLCYCQGCGCRHRQMNMEWKPSGAFQCLACCYDKAA